MVLRVADRVKDTTTTTGTGTLTLAGVVIPGYRPFNAIPGITAGDTVYYAIELASAGQWEVGLGTYTAANTLARTTVLASSNANAAVNFSTGTKDVFLTAAAQQIGRNIAFVTDVLGGNPAQVGPESELIFGLGSVGDPINPGVPAYLAVSPNSNEAFTQVDLLFNPSGVTPGSYTNANITVDSNGRVRAASNGTAGGGGPAALQSATAQLIANVTLPTTNAQVALVNVSLAAGTWLIEAHATFTRTATTAGKFSIMIGPNATVGNAYASGTIDHPSLANVFVNCKVSAIVTLTETTTVTLYGAHSAGATSNIVRALNQQNAAGATKINAIKVA